MSECFKIRGEGLGKMERWEIRARRDGRTRKSEESEMRK